MRQTWGGYTFAIVAATAAVSCSPDSRSEHYASRYRQLRREFSHALQEIEAQGKAPLPKNKKAALREIVRTMEGDAEIYRAFAERVKSLQPPAQYTRMNGAFVDYLVGLAESTKIMTGVAATGNSRSLDSQWRMIFEKLRRKYRALRLEEQAVGMSL